MKAKNIKIKFTTQDDNEIKEGEIITKILVKTVGVTGNYSNFLVKQDNGKSHVISPFQIKEFV
jgi:hypothetical protein